MTHTLTLTAMRYFKALNVSASKSDARYYLNGVYIDSEHGVIAATDGHMIVTHTDDSYKAMPSCIIPRELLDKVKINTKSASFILTFTDTTLTINDTATGTSFTDKLVDGNFPDYKRVTPSQDDQVKYGATYAAFSSELLARFDKIVKALGMKNEAVTFNAIASDSPNVGTMAGLDFVIMPMRSEYNLPVAIKKEA